MLRFWITGKMYDDAALKKVMTPRIVVVTAAIRI